MKSEDEAAQVLSWYGEGTGLVLRKHLQEGNAQGQRWQTGAVFSKAVKPYPLPLGIRCADKPFSCVVSPLEKPQGVLHLFRWWGIFFSPQMPFNQCHPATVAMQHADRSMVLGARVLGIPPIPLPDILLSLQPIK